MLAVSTGPEEPMIEKAIIDSVLERARNPCGGSIEIEPFWRWRALSLSVKEGGGVLC